MTVWMLLGLGCATEAPSWLPADLTSEIVCPLPRADRTAEMPELSWESIVYVDRDGREGAEAALRIEPGLRWSFAESNRPGQHDRVVATGTIGERGQLQGVPADLWVGARGLWSAQACTIGGEPVPNL